MKNVLKQHQLKQKYSGELQCSNCVDYCVKSSVEKLILFKYTGIVYSYLKNNKQRLFNPQIHLNQFNLRKVVHNINFNGKPNLCYHQSKGFNYCYDEYDGKIVKNLIIFNEYAQILFLNDVNLGKQSKNRDLKNKIIITQTGIHIKSQVFNNLKFKVTILQRNYKNQAVILNMQKSKMIKTIEQFIDITIRFTSRLISSIVNLKIF